MGTPNGKDDHMDSESDFTIEVAKTISEVSALRNVWTAVALDADIDFFLTLVESRPEVVRPHVIIVRNRGLPQSILVGRLETKAFVVPMGYKKISLPTVRWLTFSYGGLFGDTSPKKVSQLIDSVMNSLRKGEADIAWFHQLENNSTVFRVASDAGGAFSRDYFPIWLDHWTARLPNTYAEFVRHLSKNTRHNLKRYSKKLVDAFGDQMVITCFREPSELELLWLADCETVAAKSYHRGLQVGFINDDGTRRAMGFAANQGRLRSYILVHCVGTPSAFWNGCLFGKTFCAWTTAYDPDYADFRPGLYLLQRLVADLCEKEDAIELDFGFGDAQYKRDWCDQTRREASLFLFAPTLRGASLNLFRTSVMVGTHTARRLLTQTGLLKKGKKLWRDHLAKRLRKDH